MIVYEPFYYESFRCTASACPDSCCKDWDVQLDEAALERYRAIPGELGLRLRNAVYSEDGESYLRFADGKCPFWQADGLCHLQAELGEGALCKTCREYPRIVHDYGNFAELELELSCPEAARLILSSPALPRVSREAPGGSVPEYDPEKMDILQKSRKYYLDYLKNPEYSIADCLQTLLLYAYEVDECLNFSDFPLPDFDPEAYLCSDLPEISGTMGDIFAFYADLEILTEEWRDRLAAGPVDVPWDPRTRQLIRYFVERYWLQAVSDLDLASRAKFVVLSCLVIRHMGGDLIRAAQLYSREIENDAENMDQLLDAAFQAPEFRDAILLRLIR